MKPEFKEISLDLIQPDPHQPRKVFDDAGLETLANSIRRFGLLQPIVVRPEDEGYTIIAGERRWRASQLAGLKTVPAVIRHIENLEDGGAFLQSLSENLQRMDLNPVEKAAALKRIQAQMNWTHEEIARELGVARVTVTNLLRLLTCPPEILDYLQKGLLTEGHVRALMATTDPAVMVSIGSDAVKNAWPVRRLEREVRAKMKPGKTSSVASSPEIPPEEIVAEDPLYRVAADTLEDYFGTKVEIRKGKTSNTLVIHFYDDNSLMDILGKFPIEESI